MIVRKNKWIEGISPEQPAAEAARQALSARLEVVWHHFPLAAEASGEDVVHVHKLRVSSRRASAALYIFRDYLSPRRYRWMKRRLKAIRQAAADARDDDVLAARLAPAVEQDATGMLAEMLSQVQAHRLQAQAAIVKAHRRARRKRFDRRVAALVGHIAWRGQGAEPTYACLAKRSMREAVANFLEAAVADLSATGALHQLRIRGKRLRYTMEIFAGVFAPEFRESLYPQVEELQQLLGQVNDHAAAQVRYQRWLSGAQPGAEAAQWAKMILEVQKQLDQSLAAFFAWWTPEEAESLCQGLAEVLQ